MNVLKDINFFIEQILQEWQVPGFAIAIVKDGLPLFVKGYGYRDLRHKLPVTEKTLFPIGSTTKSFTATAIAMLVDEEKLDWNRPICEFFLDIKLYDEFTTKNITLRDLLTHRSGLPRHDGVWYTSDFSLEGIIARLQYLEPNKKLREQFQYNNLMYGLAGSIAAKIFGSKWEDLIYQKILKPLDMNMSNFSVDKTQLCSDFAFPYKKINDELTQITFPKLDHIAPAGAINSSVQDMVNYLLFHLKEGKNIGLISEINLKEIHSSQITMPEGIPGLPQFDEFKETAYGMGFAIRSYREHLLIEHGDAIDGFRSEFAFLPNDNIGVIAFANVDGYDFNPALIVYSIFDRLLEIKPIPWNDRFKELHKNFVLTQTELKNKNNTSQKLNTSPSHPLNNYIGNYENPGYGNINITLNDEGFKIILNQMQSRLRHYHYDVFEVTDDSLYILQNQKVLFHTNKQGDISSLSLKLEPLVKEIVFNRIEKN